MKITWLTDGVQLKWLNLDRQQGNLIARWFCAYQGETEIKVTGHPMSFTVRCIAHASLKDDKGDAVQGVGCIWNTYGSCQGFPPAKVCELYPEFVPAHYDLMEQRWVYQREAPATVLLPNGNTVMACLLEETPA